MIRNRAARITPYERDLLAKIVAEFARRQVVGNFYRHIDPGNSRSVTIEFTLPELIALPKLLRKLEGVA